MNIRSIFQLILGGMLMSLAACGNSVAVQGSVAGEALSTSGTPVQVGTGRTSLVSVMSGDARLLACLHCAP